MTAVHTCARFNAIRIRDLLSAARVTY
jgi:hypothetical protein